MDSIFGIGIPELIFILILAGIILGPQRIRQVARQLGIWTAQLQKISRQFTRQLNAELDALDAEEVRGAMRDVQQIKRELLEVRRELAQVSSDVTRRADEALREGKQVVRSSQELARGKLPLDSEEAAKPEAPKPGEKKTESPVPGQTRADNLPKPIEIADDPE